MEDTGSDRRGALAWSGLVAGPVLATLTHLALPDSYAGVSGESVPFSSAGRATAAVAVWMAVWWMTEAIPVYATALLPLALFPLLGAATVREAAAPYAHELIFLFMGGFVLALSMERWGLHRRIAFRVLAVVGDRATRMGGRLHVRERTAQHVGQQYRHRGDDAAGGAVGGPARGRGRRPAPSASRCCSAWPTAARSAGSAP